MVQADGWIGAASTHADIEDGRTPVGKKRHAAGGGAADCVPGHQEPRHHRRVTGARGAGGRLAACSNNLRCLRSSESRHWGPQASPFRLSAILIHDSTVRRRNAYGGRNPRAVADGALGLLQTLSKGGRIPRLRARRSVVDGERCRAFLGALSDRPRQMAGLASEIGRTKQLPCRFRQSPRLSAKRRRRSIPSTEAIFITCVARAISQALNQ